MSPKGTRKVLENRAAWNWCELRRAARRLDEEVLVLQDPEGPRTQITGC